MPEFDMETIQKITALTERCNAAEAERDALAVEANRLKACWEEEQRGEADLRDILERAKAERDALAAHVERLENFISTEDLGSEHMLNRLNEVVGEPPTTSLARLKAQWQAEAAKEHFLYGYGFCRMNGFLFDEHLQEAAEEYVKRLHRQSEGVGDGQRI